MCHIDYQKFKNEVLKKYLEETEHAEIFCKSILTRSMLLSI